MFYPFEHDTRYDPQYFVSGSDDFSVIVWNINSGTRIHRFTVHGGPVKSFMLPPSNCSVSFYNFRTERFENKDFIEKCCEKPEK